MVLATDNRARSSNAALNFLPTSQASLRLNQIEEIRANGVGDLVALPQLVVCGDQSTGKSSVLERITGIPFPRQEGLCTRFPTEILLRNAPSSDSTTITASIRPHLARSAESSDSLRSYRKVVPDMSELPSIIQDVSKLMHIRGYTDDDSGLAFASDALRIEIVGPVGLHLSVVDLPGLISVANEEQSEEDVEAVHAMVDSYLENSRTIILAVLQAGNDMANQPIIKLARKHDLEGQRTVGIITKVDLINQGAEARIAMVAKNQDTIKLKLGFFLLKNPTPNELKEGVSQEINSRRELQFFSAPAWRSQSLDADRVGADKLRLFLQDLYDAHIEREMPKVTAEIKKTLAASERELQALGNARPTIVHIRIFVTTLSMEFHQLLSAALAGNYDSIDVDFFSRQDSRLRALAHKKNTDFATFMREHGQRRKIGCASQVSDSDEEAVDETAQLIVSKTEMMQWIRETYESNRGRELPGNFNTALLSGLFHEQSRLWKAIAIDHVNNILRIVESWIDHALKALIAEDQLRREVEQILRDWVAEAETLALAELQRLLEDEQAPPLTYNHYFTDNVQNARQQDQKAAFRAAMKKVAEEDWHGKLHVSNNPDELTRFASAFESKIIVDMDEQACTEAKLQLDAYYKVALKTFVDNVARQVVERHILSPLPKAFYPSSVAEMSDDDLLRIASEPEKQSANRARLNNEVIGLRKSLSRLQRPM